MALPINGAFWWALSYGLVPGQVEGSWVSPGRRGHALYRWWGNERVRSRDDPARTASSLGYRASMWLRRREINRLLPPFLNFDQGQMNGTTGEVAELVRVLQGGAA